MRTLLIIVILILVIVAGSYGIQHALDSSSRRLSEKLSELRREIVSGHEKAAHLKLRGVNRDWNKIENGWSMITDHREMDLIDQTLVRLETLLQQNQIPLAITELDALERLVRHIPEKERFNLKNVL